MVVTIKIELFNGCYHALDVIVKSGDELKVENLVNGMDFLIAIVNRDQLISTGSLISEAVAFGQTKTIGTVNAGPNLIREYGIYPTSSSTAPNPGVDAPRRIIRIT